MDKGSGVYFTLTDQSIQVGGTSSAKLLVLMLTQKGELGINRVTAQNYKNVLGYDEKYNPNYLGLTSLVEGASYVDVWRLNQGATHANAYTTGSSWQNLTDVQAAAQVLATLNTATNGFAISTKDPGDWGTIGFQVLPKQTTTAVAAATSLSVQDVGTSAVKVLLPDTTGTQKEYNGNIVLYDALDSAIIAVVDSTNKVYAVTDGVVGSQIGTCTITSGTADITFTELPNNEPTWTVHTLPVTLATWELKSGDYNEINNVFNITSSIEFSVDSSASNFWKNVDFGDYEINIKGSLSSLVNLLGTINLLKNGSNGTLAGLLSSAELDTTPLETSDANIILANGFGTLSSMDKVILNKIAQRATALHKHLFVDLPSYTSFIDAKTWASGIFNSEYVAIAGVDDIITDADGKEISIWPSINYGIIYINMLATHGNLYYPPAGYTTGNIVANNLRETDFKRYPDELKTARINWQRNTSKGSTMWEQRTTYSLNSDLSYIAPVFIVDGLRDSLIDYEENFNFRYTTPQELLVQTTGLNSILNSFKDAGFLYSATLKVPSYAEAQKSGRTLRISIEIAITKDSEVIEIGVVLKNA